jgi:hypothetical protein
MKKLLMKAAVACLAMAMCVSFASCGDDNDEDETEVVNSDAVVTAKADYTLNLDKAWFDVFSVSVTYVTAEGKTVSEDVTSTSWSSSTTAETDGSVKTISIKVSATPKPNNTFEDYTMYAGAYSCKMEISGYKKDGTENANYGYTYSNNSTTGFEGITIKKKMTDGIFIPINATISSCEVNK